MKTVIVVILCCVLFSFAADFKPLTIPQSMITREVVHEERADQVQCIYTGVTHYPPWSTGRDAPWENPNVHIDDVYNVDDQLTSMAIDALGRIYVCYETMIDASRYGWGLATSTDNGSTWDNRVYYTSSPRSCRFPEIAISSDGKIWIYGTRQTPTSNDDVYWLKSADGSFNDPDGLEGFFWFTLGVVDHRTYPEVVTWGNSSQLVISTWTYDNGTENVVSWIYATDGGTGGSWNVYSLSSDTEPDGMTSIGADYDGANYIAVHGWEENQGGDWNVMCMIDTLETGSGLSGWGTSNPNADRYPSVFCSQGYAYIGYQADVGSSNNDVLFNYSTDYGVNWLGSMVNLTNDAADETYPRLQGDGTAIGAAYIYAGNSVRFNYSVDNGQVWLSTPETVTDNTSANGNYHSASLLYNSSYWQAAWEDSRNAGTDGLELYASRRIQGTGDITHRPADLEFNYNNLLVYGAPREKYVLRHSVQPIGQRLSEVIASTHKDEFIPIFIMLRKQLNSEYLVSSAEQMSKPERRQYVVHECKTLAQLSQRELLSYLRTKEREGQVCEITSLWSTNTISCDAQSDVIRQVAVRSDVWEIGYREPVQMIGRRVEKPTYKKIEFSPDNGREICWGVSKINADDVWLLGYTGAGVLVGHMDSGVNYNHLDLADHMWDGSGAGYPNHGYDFANDDNNPMDDNGHGTQTAGIVAGDGTCGSNTGVAPDAEIMALKIYPGTNTEMGLAIQFALDNGADLLSCSIGWLNPSNSIKNWCRGQSNTVYAAGIVWCNSAGNGNNMGGHYAVPQDIISPADCPGPYYAPNGGSGASIAVAATDLSDNVASFSSYGPTHWNTGAYTDYPYPPGLLKPDVAAPGVNCKSLDHSTNNQYDNGINGTSFAQPHLAGTVALMLSRNPALTPRQIDSLIQTTAVDIETAGRDTLSGEGRIDALQAVNAISGTARWAQLWVINQPTATGLLSVTDITKAQGSSWITSVAPATFSVPVNDSQEVIVTVDTTGQGLVWGQTYYDTLLVWSNSLLRDNPERVPVTLIMATIGVPEDEAINPTGHINLLSALPNPFRNAVRIDYAVSYPQNIHFTIHDVCGKKVRTLIDRIHEPGSFSIIWDGRDDHGRRLAAGVYLGRIETETHAAINKLILIK